MAVLPACFLGCEITDYEPLIAKKELKELARENERLKQENAAISAENNRLKTNGSQQKELVSSPAVNVDQAAVANEMEQLGVYVGWNDSGNGIVELDFTDAVYENEKLKAIVNLPSLKKLFVNGSQADVETFEIVGQIGSLEHLEIPISPATPEALAHLTGLKKTQVPSAISIGCYRRRFQSFVDNGTLAASALCPNENFERGIEKHFVA